MTLEELDLICELPNYSSFADASFYLPYSPAVITKYVNNVENELGIRLFVRSNKSRSLQLTDEGKALFDSLRRISEDYGFLKKQASLIKNADNHRIRIGSQPRFGNIHEQKIIAGFLLQNPTAQVSMHKYPADELIRGLIAGKVDVAMITFNKTVHLDQYFGENRPKIDATFLVSEPNMFVGVSEQYFPGRTEISLKELEDFTLAFPFPNSNDLQSARALQSWQTIAVERDIHLKYINLQGYDNTVFEMALAQKFAITTNNIPSVNYPGIHFLKLCDWTGGNNLYLVMRSGQQSESIRQFEQVALAYSASLQQRAKNG